ncbi:DnaJ-domain-containing protein [Parathielavia appendiculata]|uniref:DnaJ-domain-containing protein n=1 Tax=Parathielavia appendiculata TaxID=2587402 RepID=A0AAN6TWC5_9PEZI|nr:DnaJ-domain-containing protein [Parathielavia appendiculata]
MPLRYTLPSAAWSAQLPLRTAIWQTWTCPRLFHASPRALRLDTNPSDDASNHYETLNVHPDASPAEIKRSFYLLSKRHHPDHNPTDPSSPTRFMRISEAYATLSHAEKRARYDRDVMRLRSNPHYHHHPKGSYHSTGPAGGRPASGLSNRSSRRGTYQGPPPSFFRSGGWGAHAAKRRAAHEESTGFYGTRATASSSSSGGRSSGTGMGRGGMGPGQDPFGHHHDVPHFDRAAHEREQRRLDERRAHRMARQRGVDIDHPESPVTMGFLSTLAILVVVVMAPVAFIGSRAPASPPPRGGGEKEGSNDNKEKEWMAR